MIEHIPGDGDAQAMSELARVLRPGALLVLTFPYRKQFEDEFVEHDLYGTRFEGEPIFFCRHYSGDAVQERFSRAAHSTSSSRCCGERKASRRLRLAPTGSSRAAGRSATSSGPCSRF